MDCKKTGIGLIILSITLFFGITISETLTLNEAPDTTIKEVILKDCVPVDRDLKYYFIDEGETKTIHRKVENVEELEKLLNESEIDSETKKQLKRIEKEADLRNSSFENLIFIQKCRSEKLSQ